MARVLVNKHDSTLKTEVHTLEIHTNDGIASCPCKMRLQFKVEIIQVNKLEIRRFLWQRLRGLKYKRMKVML